MIINKFCKGNSFLKWIITTSVLIILMICFLPTIMSTYWGNNVVLTVANSFVNGKIEVSSFKLSWFGPQEAEGIRFTGATGEEIFVCKNLHTDWYPLHFLSFSKDIGSSSLIEPKLSLTVDEKGKSDLYSAVNSSTKPADSPVKVTTPTIVTKENSSPFNPTTPTLALKKTLVTVPFSGKIEIQKGIVEVNISYTKSIKFNNISLKFEVPQGRKELYSQFSTETVQGSQKGSIDFNISLQSPSKEFALAEKITTNLHSVLLASLAFKAKNVPLIGVEEIIFFNDPDQRGFLTALLGSTLDFEFNLELSPEESSLEFVAESSLFKANIYGATKDKEFSLSKPGVLNLQITPKFVQSLWGKDNIELNGTAVAALQINEFRGPDEVFNSWESFLQNYKLQAQLDVTPFTLKRSPDITSVDVSATNIALTGKNLNHLSMDGQTQLSLKDKEVSQFIGSSITLNFQGTPELYPEPSLSNLSLIAQSEKLSGSIKGALSSKNFEMTDNLQLKYVVDPKRWDKFSSPFLPKPTAPFTLQLAIVPQNFSFADLNNNSLEKLHVKGKLAVDKVKLVSPLETAVTLSHASVDFDINNLANKLQLLFSSELEGGKQKGILNIDSKVVLTNYLKMGKYSPKTTHASFHLNLPKIPTSLMDEYLKKGELFTDIFGPTLSFEMQSSFLNLDRPEGRFTMNTSSNTLNGEMDLRVSDNLSLYGSPAKFSWTVSPKAFSSIYQHQKIPTDLILQKPFTVNVKLQDLNWEVDWSKLDQPKKVFPLDKIGTKFEIVIPEFSIYEQSSRKDSSLSDFSIKASTKELADSVKFSLHTYSKIKGLSGREAKKGTVSIQGSMSNLLHEKKVDFAKARIVFTGDFENFPTKTLSPLILLDQEIETLIEAIMGAEMNANISVDLDAGKGPVNLEVTSQNSQASVQAKMDNGILQLNKDAQARLILTPHMIKILEKFYPLLEGVNGAENPIIVTIGAKGTSIPILPLDIAKINVGESNLELGKLRFSSSNTFSPLLKILKTGTDTRNINVWFSILRIYIQNGIMTIKRTDALLDSKVHIAIWGKINFVDDKVNMILAITGSSLRRILGNKGINADQYLQFPVEGSDGEVRIKEEEVIKAITSLSLKKSKSIFGNIVGRIISEIKKKGDVPVPPAPPIPWTNKDIRGYSSSVDGENIERSPKEPKRKDIKEEMKGAVRSFLDDFSK